MRHRLLKNSSRSAAPLDLFRLCERGRSVRQTVASLTLTPQLQGSALIKLLAVAFDCRPVNTETAGSLGLGNALVHRLDDLLPEVQRICTHASTLPGTPSSQSAVSHSARSLAPTPRLAYANIENY